MKAATFIQSLLDSRLETQNPRNAKKYRHFLESVKDFLGPGAEQLTLAEMATPAWRQRYSQYLATAPVTSRTGAQTQGYSKGTIEERLSALTIICRKAIRHSLLPNISLDPSADAPEIAKLEIPDCKADLLMLMAKYSSTADAIRVKELLADTPRQELSALRRTHHNIGLAILAVLCGGIGLSGLAQLRRSDYDGDTLRLPFYGRKVLLPDSIQLIIEDIKSCAGTEADGLIYADWKKTRTLLSEENLSPLSIQIQKDLRDLGIALRCPFGESLTQFVNIALLNGVAPVQLQQLMAERYPGQQAPQGRSVLQAVVDIVAKDYGHLSRHWYGGSCKIDNQQFVAQLNAEEKNPIKPKDFFAPYLPEVKEVRGKTQIANHRQLSRMFFFKGVHSQARALQLLMGIKGFIYTKTYEEAENESNKYQTIPEREIENLRKFLEAKSKKLIHPTDAMNLYGCRVRVKVGIFKGCEGVIEDRALLKPRADGSKTFTSLAITILGRAVVAHPHIDTSILELI